MLVLLSPAKNMNFDPVDRDLPKTQPSLIDETRILSKTTRGLTISKIKTMMKINDDLAKLNRERFQAFDAEHPGEKQAAFAFNGEVYRGLDAASLSAEDLDWAQEHLRLLSGMYGTLRLLDGIHPIARNGPQPYMRRGESSMISQTIAKDLNAAMDGDAAPVILNLPNEYFKSVDKKVESGHHREFQGNRRTAARPGLCQESLRHDGPPGHRNRVTDPADLVKPMPAAIALSRGLEGWRTSSRGRSRRRRARRLPSFRTPSYLG